MRTHFSCLEITACKTVGEAERTETHHVTRVSYAQWFTVKDKSCMNSQTYIDCQGAHKLAFIYSDVTVSFISIQRELVKIETHEPKCFSRCSYSYCSKQCYCSIHNEME